MNTTYHLTSVETFPTVGIFHCTDGSTFYTADPAVTRTAELHGHDRVVTDEQGNVVRTYRAVS